jgi:hypothetical protein
MGKLSFGSAAESDGGGYRASASIIELRPVQDGSWPDRPLPLVVDKPRLPRHARRALGVAIASGLLGLGAMGVAIGRGESPFAPTARPACGSAVDAALADDDLERARTQASGCADPLARAHLAWADGDFKGAASSFADARRRAPERVPTVSEIEAVALAGEERKASELTLRLAGALYPGPSTPERERLECVAWAFARRTGDAAALEALISHHGRGAGCAILGREFGHDTWLDPLPLGVQSRGEHAVFARLDDERLHQFLTPGDMSYDSAALYPDAWFARYHPHALDQTVLAAARARKWPDDATTALGARAEAVSLRNVASYDLELAIFLALMGRPWTEVNAHLEGVRASDVFEEANAAKIQEGFIQFASHQIGDDGWEARSHADRRQALHAGAAAAAMLAGDPAPERWLVDAQPFMGSLVEHHLALVRAPDRTEIDIAGRYPHGWPHHDLFEAAELGPAAVAEALAKSRVVNPSIVRELVARTKRGPGDLVEWVSHRFPAPCWDCGLSALAAHVGVRLLDARAVGAESVARSLEPIADRLVAAVLRRDIAPELFVLELDPAQR